MELKDIVKHGRTSLGLNRPQFVILFNEEEPLDVTLTYQQLVTYEIGLTTCPSHRFIKMLELFNRELRRIGEKPIEF